MFRLFELKYLPWMDIWKGGGERRRKPNLVSNSSYKRVIFRDWGSENKVGCFISGPLTSQRVLAIIVEQQILIFAYSPNKTPLIYFLNSIIPILHVIKDIKGSFNLIYTLLGKCIPLHCVVCKPTLLLHLHMPRTTSAMLRVIFGHVHCLITLIIIRKDSVLDFPSLPFQQD